MGQVGKGMVLFKRWLVGWYGWDGWLAEMNDACMLRWIRVRVR